MAAEETNRELDKARADALIWAIEPTSEMGKYSAARLNPTQPFAFSLFRAIMNQRAEWASCTFKEPATGDFDPKIHFTITKGEESALGKKIMDNLLGGTMAVKGERAERVLETNKDIGRPQQNMFGGLGEFFKNKDEELTEPAEQ